MNQGKTVYLIISKAELIKRIGVNPIYQYQGEYYVGLETLTESGEDIENSVEFSTLSLAEEFANELPQ